MVSISVNTAKAIRARFAPDMAAPKAAQSVLRNAHHSRTAAPPALREAR